MSIVDRYLVGIKILEVGYNIYKAGKIMYDIEHFKSDKYILRSVVDISFS
jgi:hypothetical protein